MALWLTAIVLPLLSRFKSSKTPTSFKCDEIAKEINQNREKKDKDRGAAIIKLEASNDRIRQSAQHRCRLCGHGACRSDRPRRSVTHPFPTAERAPASNCGRLFLIFSQSAPERDPGPPNSAGSHIHKAPGSCRQDCALLCPFSPLMYCSRILHVGTSCV